MDLVFAFLLGIVFLIFVLLAIPFLAFGFCRFMQWYEDKLYQWFKFKV